jgi:hypothetical protein
MKKEETTKKPPGRNTPEVLWLTLAVLQTVAGIANVVVSLIVIIQFG